MFLLSLFRTRMIYYIMQILPFMALLAAVAFIHFTQISSQKSSWYRLVTLLSYAFSGLGILLPIAGIIILLNQSFVSLIITPEIRTYALPTIVLGCGWMSIASLWQSWQPGKIPYWLAGWFIPAWFTIFSFGWESALADKSPEFRTEFARSFARSIVTQPINLLSDTVAADGFQPSQYRDRTLTKNQHKTLILLSFYTPRLGKHIYKFTDLPDRAYAWTLQIPPQQIDQALPTLRERVRFVDKIQGWHLIQKIGEVDRQ
ncbi:MAG: hypothetical protein HC778_00985 [Chamaesiphon sp. CSU_1_12]|nr:hypothetical protein [Chamaesiphon sp. CSU_1_12]